MGHTVRALLTVYTILKQQILCLDRELARYARGSETCRRLMTIPGIGLLTAIAFIAAIDDPVRFAKSSSVGAYLGLTPRRYQSGEADHNGKISKCGDPLVRAYLFEAATTLLTRVEKWSALKAWGLRIAKKSGMKKPPSPLPVRWPSSCTVCGRLAERSDGRRAQRSRPLRGVSIAHQIRHLTAALSLARTKQW
ncbi:hypothetical protein ILFOPFJJ_05700 [Ensifer psoraleae]|uniref:transposase n=1 Tax=Sinorhizobium psoraleae TaxID=520838 RepID=UPI0024AAD56C|nr:transposase [Sinorhizobium psoraleae]NRP74778.1 hypothetical protein [Sinorhizobium psoraleae]